MLTLTIELPVQMTLIAFAGLCVEERRDAADELVACAANIRSSCASSSITTPGGVAGIDIARRLFRTLGIDPTRRRPSSEALLNRALKDKPMPNINTLVDVGNWCSLDFLLPLGIYDVARLSGDLRLRQGQAGESYQALSNRELNLEGRYVLADDEGPFGSPMTDSVRAAVTTSTVDAVILLYAPADFDPATLTARTRTMAERVTRYCGGVVAQETMVHGKQVAS